MNRFLKIIYLARIAIIILAVALLVVLKFNILVWIVGIAVCLMWGALSGHVLFNSMKRRRIKAMRGR